MKKVGKIIVNPFLYLMFSLLLFVGCEKDDITEPVIEEEEEVVIILEKKGAAFTTGGLEWSHDVAGLKPFWHYSWGSDLSDMEPDNVEFIPMTWGKSSASDENIAKLKQLANEGKIKYLLGFNEPDGAQQANMTVDEAIALWPKLEEVGVPLGSPATVGHLSDWIKEFMTKAAANNLRVDFVCVHNYGGPNSANLKKKLQETYAEFNKPIWLTEFAVGDWNANTPEENKHSPLTVRNFMKDALPMLDKLEFVERYAWFSANLSNPALTSSALYDDDGNLTQLGMVYLNHNPNADCGAGIDAPIYSNIEGNLIPNGNFGDFHIYGDPNEKASASVGWYGYQFGVEPTDVVEGWAAKMQNGWSGNSAMSNVFPVEAGKTYQLSFYAKWLGSIGSIKMTLKNRDSIIAWEEAGKPAGSKPPVLASSPVIKADDNGNNEWTQVSFEYTIPEGTSNIELTFWKPEGSSQCLIDEVLAKEKI
jgi:hypothetical protein